MSFVVSNTTRILTLAYDSIDAEVDEIMRHRKQLCLSVKLCMSPPTKASAYKCEIDTLTQATTNGKHHRP